MNQPAPPVLPLIHLHAVPESAEETVRRRDLVSFLASPAALVRIDFDSDITVDDGKRFGTVLVAFSDGTFERVLAHGREAEYTSMKARVRAIRNMISGRSVPPYSD